MIPATVVFRPRAGTWVMYGFLTLVIIASSLYWFFEPMPMVVRYIGGGVIIFWIFYLANLAGSRLELRDNTIEVYGPSFQVVHPRELHWLYYAILLLVIFDLAAVSFGPLPLSVRRSLLGFRVVWTFAYLWCFGMFEGGRRSVQYTEIATAPAEHRLTPTAIRLQMGISGNTIPFMFPYWLNDADRSEVAGRVTSRMKHAQVLQQAHEQRVHAQQAHAQRAHAEQAHETDPGAATAAVDSPGSP